MAALIYAALTTAAVLRVLEAEARRHDALPEQLAESAVALMGACARLCVADDSGAGASGSGSGTPGHTGSEEEGASGHGVEDGCIICMAERNDTALLCGHVFCAACATEMDRCALCRRAVTHRIKLWT